MLIIKNSLDLSTKVSLGKKHTTGNQMRQKKWRKGQRKVPLKINKHNDDDDIFPNVAARTRKERGWKDLSELCMK